MRSRTKFGLGVVIALALITGLAVVAGGRPVVAGSTVETSTTIVAAAVHHDQFLAADGTPGAARTTAPVTDPTRFPPLVVPPGYRLPPGADGSHDTACPGTQPCGP